jgi:hypothetical protein
VDEVPDISDMCLESTIVENNKKEHPRVSECFSITGAVAEFFKSYGYKKGDVIQPNRIRELLIDYSTSNVSL